MFLLIRAPSIPPASNSEVVPRARRRMFTNADKRRILQAADLCTRPGEVGALMRREGVYSSSLSTWRRQREVADLAALAPQKRGPKPDPARIDALQIAQLTRERDKLRVELGKAQLVIEVQKKSCRAARSPGDPGQGREHLMAAVQELTPALGAGAACRALGLWRGVPARQQARSHRRTLVGPPRPRAPRPCPPLALDAQEQQALLAALNSERFADTAPAAVHATLLDEGT